MPPIVCSGLGDCEETSCLVGYAWVSELCASSLDRQLGAFNMAIPLDEQCSHIGVLFVQVGKDSVECNRDCVICGSVGAVCELDVWEGVDVSHNQSFKACYGYRCEYHGR